MPDIPKTLLAWSSGKDSAWALHTLRERGDVDVVGLLTTFDEEAGRVSMHAVREELVQAQAHAVGLPLHAVKIPTQCSNEQYETVMNEVLSHRMHRDPPRLLIEGGQQADDIDVAALP